jgi:hypothetical protein
MVRKIAAANVIAIARCPAVDTDAGGKGNGKAK